MKPLFVIFMLVVSFNCLANCDKNDSPFLCFVGASANPVYLGSDGLYHTDYYCSEMVSSYYSPDKKGNLSGEWHYLQPFKSSSCDFYRESDRLSRKSRLDNCLYWKEHNMEIPEKYHCDKILKVN